MLKVVLISVDALGQEEQHLIVAAITSDNDVLTHDDPEKLLRLPAEQQLASRKNSVDSTLMADMDNRKEQVLREINQRNLGYFEQELLKLDAWADDLKMGLEREIKEVDIEIKEVRRLAATSPTLEEKLVHQKCQRDLEAKRSKLRRELFARQDIIESERNDLISGLEMQMEQKVRELILFTVEWELK